MLPRLRGGFGRPYYYAAETPTTQKLAPDDAPHGAVAVAEHQTEGRGRLGRVWVDEPGAGLALSITLRPPPPLAHWPELTLVAARAVADAIGDGATIKDPNDVLLDGRKVAGILAEAGDHVVLGIGVNVGTRTVAGSRRGRPRPARAARRDPRPARAGLRRLVAHGQLICAPALPAASRACTVNDVTGPAVHGNLERAARLAHRDRLAVHDRRHGRRLADVEAQRRCRRRTLSTGAVVSIVTGCSSDTVPSDVVAVTSAT